ncbi:hypothetical protein TNCV_1465531 [Trichonephila clavipes]|nr:hypothetical protein TNCV_1465531 [Trichonephila clavipes]
MALYRSPLTVTLWPSSFLKKYGPMIPPTHKAYQQKVGGSSTSRMTMLERSTCTAVEMEAIASEAASGTNSAREAARRLGLPPSSVRNILRRILQLYPYKLQSCHELLPADTAQREAFAKRGLL